jgi:hypothetical protein
MGPTYELPGGARLRGFRLLADCLLSIVTLGI